MVSVELPTPRFIRRGLAKNTDPVIELTELSWQSGEFSEMFVEFHGIARGFIGALANAGAQHAIGEFALLVA